MAKKTETKVSTEVDTGSEDVIRVIRKCYPRLSKKLKIVAKYIVDNPHNFALNSLSIIADKLEVPQSTLVRMAKFVGLSNGQELQKRIRESLLSNSDYSSRVRQINEDNTKLNEELSSPYGTLQKLTRQNTAAFHTMLESIDPEQMSRITDILADTPEIYLASVRRVFPLMLSMRYGLSHFHKRVHIITGIGGMFNEEAANITKDSVVFTISFHPYSPEPILVQKVAMEKGAKNILVTDSEFHPLFDMMDESVIIRDAEVVSFRSLSATMCFTHALTLSVGLKLNEN
mgnify:CR=1 FL=1